MSDKERDDTNGEPGDERPDNEIEGDRALPSINKKKSGSGSAVGKVLGLFAILGIAALMLMVGGKREPEPESDGGNQRQPGLARGLPEFRMPDPPRDPEPVVPAPRQSNAPAPQESAEPVDDLLERRKRAPLLAVSQGASAGQREPAESSSETERQRQAISERRKELQAQLEQLQAGVGGVAFSALGAGGDGAGQAGGDAGPLEASLVSTNTVTVQAGMLENRHFLVPKGTFLDCAMITAISSEQPGFASCRLTRNIYSDTGRVLLLERGSIVEGEYQSGQTRRGSSRIFVLWTRVRTPHGVVVDLDSPGTDQLGRSGLTGWVDRHFGERFGAAILLSLIDGASQYMQERARGDGGSIFLGPGTENTSRIGELALQDSIGIPPTIHVNQGEHINVYVARDLDFSGVYALRQTLEQRTNDGR